MMRKANYWKRKVKYAEKNCAQNYMSSKKVGTNMVNAKIPVYAAGCSSCQGGAVSCSSCGGGVSTCS